VSEAPGNSWYGSWKNACEEASIAMVDYYYEGKRTATVAESKKFMQGLFAVQRKLWGSDANSDAAQTAQLANDHSSFSARVVEAPTLAQIKSELDGGRPVIVPLSGFKLANPNIPFLPSGSGYHMLAVIGYDDAKNQFIVNDVGDNTEGAGYRYGYSLFMDAIHDYDAKRQKADAPARAIFTTPKLAKTASSHRIYFVNGTTKQYVSHPAVFAQKGWSWSWINVVPEPWLRRLETGANIVPR
jgi:hypothetical protein